MAREKINDGGIQTFRVRSIDVWDWLKGMELGEPTILINKLLQEAYDEQMAFLSDCPKK